MRHNSLVSHRSSEALLLMYVSISHTEKAGLINVGDLLLRRSCIGVVQDCLLPPWRSRNPRWNRGIGVVTGLPCQCPDTNAGRAHCFLRAG